jgi:hypothetical protein
MISVYHMNVWILSVQNILCNSNMVRHLLSWPLYGTSKCLITTFVPAIDSQPFPHESPRRQLGTEPIRLQASCLTVELSPQIWWLDQLDPRLWLLNMVKFPTFDGSILSWHPLGIAPSALHLSLPRTARAACWIFSESFVPWPEAQLIPSGLKNRRNIRSGFGVWKYATPGHLVILVMLHLPGLDWLKKIHRTAMGIYHQWASDVHLDPGPSWLMVHGSCFPGVVKKPVPPRTTVDIKTSSSQG